MPKSSPRRAPRPASGIGEATVSRFLAEGVSVAFCDRDGERGQRVAAELETAGAPRSSAGDLIARVGAVLRQL